MTTEEAKAVSAVAVTTGKALDALSGIGRYAAEVFGTVPHDLVGHVAGGDWLKRRRAQRIEALALEANPYLKDVDPARISPPSPSVMIPLMIAAADEERPELQDLWARLLANAAIDGGKKVRRDFFATVSKMEPLDAVVLELFRGGPIATSPSEQMAYLTRHLRGRLQTEISDLDRDVSLAALRRLGCLDFSVFHVASQYGQALLQACAVV